MTLIMKVKESHIQYEGVKDTMERTMSRKECVEGERTKTTTEPLDLRKKEALLAKGAVYDMEAAQRVPGPLHLVHNPIRPLHLVIFTLRPLNLVLNTVRPLPPAPLDHQAV